MTSILYKISLQILSNLSSKLLDSSKENSIDSISIPIRYPFMLSFSNLIALIKLKS